MVKLSRRLHNKQRTGAELVTLVISLALLIALVGGLAWLEVSRGDEPARIRVTPHFDQAARTRGAWYLPVTITNTGDRATGMLRVDLSRPIPGNQPEVADLSFQFVAGGEQVEGIAVFDARPTRASIQADVVSVTEP